MDGYKEVSREEFYEGLAGLDVHPHIVGSFPYTSIFFTPRRVEYGRVIDYYPEGRGLTESRYLRPNAGNQRRPVRAVRCIDLLEAVFSKRSDNHTLIMD